MNELNQPSELQVIEELRAGTAVCDRELSRLELSGEFPAPVILERVQVTKLILSNATFHQGIAIKGCEIRRLQGGGKTVVTGTLDLQGTDVRRMDLGPVEISDDLRLDNFSAQQLARLNQCQIGGSVRLWQARFEEWLEVNQCEIQGRADFRSIHACEGVVFRDCSFASEFLLRGSTVTKKLEFARCRFESLTDFSKAKLHDVVYLDSIEQGPEQRFAFENALLNRVLISPGKIQGHLASEVEKRYAQAAAEYGLLRQNFQNLHRYEDEDWAFYRFKINQRKSRPTSWLRPWSKLVRLLDILFLDLGCGYGARPSRAVRTALFLMVLFAGIYAMGSQQLNMERAPLPEYALDHPLNRALYGLMTSVSVFTAGFTGEHLRSAQGWMLLPLAVEALLGTLLWGLFVVAFSRKIIR